MMSGVRAPSGGDFEMVLAVMLAGGEQADEAQSTDPGDGCRVGG